MTFCKQGVLIAAALWTLSCSGSKQPETSGSAPAERPRLVFITNSNSPFWEAARKGLDDAAKEFGAEVELIRNDSSPAGQIRRLEQVAAQRDVKGVMVSVVEPNASGIIDQMKALRAKGIPVLALDSDGQKETRGARRVMHTSVPTTSKLDGPWDALPLNSCRAEARRWLLWEFAPLKTPRSG
jgi:ABC-type sugar transport system substrate-binding protein